jgi:adenylate kinase
VKLLQKAMASAVGKNCFLIDGFPRNLDNVTGWNEVVGDSVDLAGCLFFEATEEELEKRLMGRGQGRDDDNIETIKKRFKTYVNETQPIGDLFKGKGMLMSIDGMKPIEDVWESTRKLIQKLMAKPKVLFVLGGPGVGKGTQCSKIIESFPNWAHISAGDCLRAERQDPNSKDGELINSYIKDGKIVPVAITVKLIQKAMSAAMDKTCFLIDGFPRNLDNVNGWNEVVGDSADLAGCLFYEATEEELEKRLMGRGQGRDDDNIETIKKRFKTYVNETQPIGDLFKGKGMLISIDGMKPIDDVWASTRKVIQDIEKNAS